MDDLKHINGIEEFDSVPDGWVVLRNANMAPLGFRFICNNKSRWSGEYKHALVHEEAAREWLHDHTRQTDGESPQ